MTCWEYFNWPNILQEAKARLEEASRSSDRKTLEYWTAWCAHANLAACVDDGEAKMDILTDVIHDWGIRAFGEENFNSPQERVLRLLEEAAELAQSEEIDLHTANRVLISVYDRPRGVPMHEAGGVMLTLIAYFRTRGWNAESILLMEVRRVLDIPIEKFRQRNKEKIKADLTKVRTTK